MKIVKVSYVFKNDGVADYKGIDLNNIVAGSQIYPNGINVAYLIVEGDIPTHKDIKVISEDEYLVVKNQNDIQVSQYVSPEQRIEQLEGMLVEQDALLMDIILGRL